MSQDDSTEFPDPSSMRIREIKDELNEMRVSFTDCFDKDSLVTRLIDARSGAVVGTSNKNASDESGSSPSSSEVKTSNFDKEAAMEDLRSKKVRELRTMCAEKNIKWANMIEKEELVRALAEHQARASKFSKSGMLTPGKVSTITGDILGKEVEGGATTPLLLDVYATWCGPCKLMAPQLDEAAAILGDKVRVAKLDSDQHPDWAGKLQVQGLPTVIVFDGQSGKELDRVEGALMRDQLIEFAQKYT